MFVAGVGRIAGAVVAGIMFSAAGLFVTFLDIHLSVGKYQAIVAGVALVLTAVQNPDGLTSTATGKGPAVALAKLRDRAVRLAPGGAPARPRRRAPGRRGSRGSRGGPGVDRGGARGGAARRPPTRSPDARVTATPPRRLRVEHLRTPLGLGVRRPRFSWWLPAGAERQLAYRVRADNGWDTGRVRE